MDIKIEKIIRTKRKTIALQITDDAALIVRAPFKLSDESIMRVVSKHKRWIKKKKKEIESRDPKFAPKEFVSGEGFLYLGRYYKLEIVSKQDIPLRFNNKFFLLKKAASRARELFLHWYKQEAYNKILERVKHYAKKNGYKFNKLNITNSQKRWASCSNKNNLNFSWRLIMAPLPVIDFVVIHELAHLDEKNHSKAFWTKLRILMPDYEKYKNWLKENGHLLRL